MIRLLLAILLLIAPLCGLAQDNALVRLEVLPETVNVGEPAELRVTVLGPTWFARPPVFPSFEIPNAIVRLPPDSSFPSSEQIGRERWSGVTRQYQVYPLVPGRYDLGGQAVRLTIANPGADPDVVDAMLPVGELLAVVPAGAEGLDPYLAGASLVITRDVQGDLEQLAPGDAVVVVTTAEIDGLPAMFLPPLNPGLQIDGVSVYPDEPRVEDGETGRRAEKHTLIFNSGGAFTLPGIELEWWDVDAGQIEIASIPAQVLTVEGQPLPADDQPENTGRDWKTQLLSLAGAALLGYLGWRLIGWLKERVNRRRDEIKASEAYAFSKLELAIRAEDPEKAYHALLTWLSRLSTRPDAHAFVRDYGDTGLQMEFRELSKKVYRNSTRKLRWNRLAKGFAKSRQTYLSQQPGARESAVPPLNP